MTKKHKSCLGDTNPNVTFYVSSRFPLCSAARRVRVRRPELGGGVVERGCGPELPEGPEQRGCEKTGRHLR